MSVLLRDRCRSALLWALAGDCLGAPFEGNQYYKVGFGGSAEAERKWAKRCVKFVGGVAAETPRSGEQLTYTDDTAMTLDLAESLADNGAHVDQKRLARRFAETYLSPGGRGRGYGGAVGRVFTALARSGYAADPVQLAAAQFDGGGSYGNGAAMRAAPVALALCGVADWHERLVDITGAQAALTHSHYGAVAGAVLQAAAVRMALDAPLDDGEAASGLDAAGFVGELRAVLALANDQLFGLATLADKSLYSDKLDGVESLLCQSQPPTAGDVISRLGNSIAASESVPTALFAFLRGAKGWWPDEVVERVPPVTPLRTIAYALTLAGDTDTIGCMCAAMAGARHYAAAPQLPTALADRLEGVRRVDEAAGRLYDVQAQAR